MLNDATCFKQIFIVCDFKILSVARCAENFETIQSENSQVVDTGHFETVIQVKQPLFLLTLSPILRT